MSSGRCVPESQNTLLSTGVGSAMSSLMLAHSLPMKRRQQRSC
jgi:hypothetical protein